MKTNIIKRIVLVAILLFAPAAIFAADAATGAAGATGLPAALIESLFKVAAWYGVACAAFNGLVTLIAAVVKQSPGTSDDEAVDKVYASGPYKAVAWIFSWGDYIAEFVAKLKK
jgi:hypothetical protein